ncbi:hypothetical protein J4474_03135 [Candidatus Pacearchaeota archaeon]|nr:hypothetical protein [Candidatus Pacearchaeota archaeon]
MGDGNYEKILLKISKAASLDKEEIERRVEAKRAKLSGLISREGAMQIIASELGINFDNEKLKIDELLPGMRRVNVIGKIIGLSPVRTFVRNGKEGKVANFTLADEKSNVKVVLWDVNHIELIEKNELGKESVVEILNGSMRGNELHLGSFSEFKKSNEKISNVNIEKQVYEKKIIDFKNPDSVGVRAFIVQAFEPKFFYVCPECKKKVGEDSTCATHGSVAPEKRAVMNVVIDDGTESIRAVLFHDNIPLLGFDLEDSEKLTEQKQNILGKEMFFLGDVRNNNYFNNAELIINSVKEINFDELLAKIESN